MKKLLLKILDIEDHEMAPVLLLLGNSFFLGLFLVTFDVVTSTLFLDTYGEAYLSRAIILSGVAGIVSTYLYVQIQRRMPFATFAILNLLVVSIFVAGLTFGLELTSEKKLIFLGFIVLGPLNAVLILGFYGIVSRSFNLKDEKRITFTVDQGQMIATTIAFFAIPIIQEFIHDTRHLMFISTASIIIALLLIIWFSVRYGSYSRDLAKTKPKIEVVKMSYMLKNRYIFFLGLLLFFSVVATRFVEYSFFSLSVQKYPDAKDLANFLAYYGATLTLFSFAVQTFIGDRIINMYGMKVSLLILPVLLLIFTALSSAIGSLFGYTIDATSFILFFLMISMSKLFLSTTKDTFEDPIIKNFFLPFDAKLRYDIQSKIEGVFKEFSGLIAGVAITLLGSLHFFELIHYSYFLVLVFVGYAYACIRLYSEYRHTLTDTLVKQQGSEEVRDYEITEVLKREAQSNIPDKKIFTLKLMEKIEPLLLENSIGNVISEESPALREYAIKRIDDLKIIGAKDKVKLTAEKESSPLVRQLALTALYNLNEAETMVVSSQRVLKNLKSRNPDEREYAAKVLSKNFKPEYLAPLISLMRDPHPKVRIAAIITAGKVKSHELWPVLLENLSSPSFGNAAASSFCAIGPTALPSLETAFHRTGQNLQTMIRIVQIFGRIGGDEAIELLWDKVDFPDKKIVSQALLCLSTCGYRPQGEREVWIKNFLQKEIGNAAWNIAALSEIDRECKNSKYLVEALEEEIEHNNSIIYMLLSLIYDAQSIRLVKENLESGTVEGTVYALELMDVFLGEDIQPMLFPLVEDIPQEERNERLQQYFPRETLSSLDVLIHIINRDYNSINRWTKACAMYTYPFMTGAKVKDDLVANLFNPDPLMRETAAWAINTLDPKAYQMFTGRLDEKIKKVLDANIFSYNMNTELDKNLMVEEILFLKEIAHFSKIPGLILSYIAESTDELIFKKGNVILAKGENGSSPFFLIRHGKVKVQTEEGLEMESKIKYGMIGETLVLDTDINEYVFTAEEDTFCYRLDKDKFYELMSNNYEMAREYLNKLTEFVEFVKENNDALSTPKNLVK
ncbi:MAG: HEAT repeat domain-containing protein [Cytophagales bacterium]|nr:HEAT repeat domain-containing protein [Cytophagales bacterium]